MSIGGGNNSPQTPIDPGGGGGAEIDCIPGLPCINFVKEAKKRWPAIEKCLQDARDMAIGALNDLRSRLPFDGVWASQVAVGAAGGGYLGKVPGLSLEPAHSVRLAGECSDLTSEMKLSTEYRIEICQEA